MQVGQQGRWANKAGGPTRQVGQQGRWANKAGGPTWQVGEQGSRAGLIDVPALTSNIFVAATNRTSIHNKTCPINQSIEWDVWVWPFMIKDKNALLALTSGLYYIIFMNVIYNHKLSFSLERELE